MSLEWTKKGIESARPDPSKILTFSDPLTSGLYLRINSGGSKVFYFVYRLGGRDTKKQWLKIGEFGTMTLVQAREVVQVYKAKLILGNDPAEAKRKAAAVGITVADAAKRFMSEYAPANLRYGSIVGYEIRIRDYILPTLGKIPIGELSRETVSRWHSSYKGKVSANRALTVLSSICTQSEIWGLRQQGTNPCKYVKKYSENPRMRDISPKELEAIGKTISYFEKFGAVNPWALAAIKIIALCAGRVSEVLGLKYNKDLNLEEGYALLREHKTSKSHGAKHLELPKEAVEIINGLPTIDSSDYVFPSRINTQPMGYTCVRKVWMKICDKAGVEDLHLHDFRSYAASEGLEQGIDSRTTAKLLGHSSSQTTEKHYLKVRKRKTAEAAAQIARPIAKAFKLS